VILLDITSLSLPVWLGDEVGNNDLTFSFRRTWKTKIKNPWRGDKCKSKNMHKLLHISEPSIMLVLQMKYLYTNNIPVVNCIMWTAMQTQ